MSVAEAMASGCPVVVGRGSPWPQIETWRAGHWVENTCGAVTAAMDALAADPVVAREMGENGRRAVAQHLDWNRLAARMLGAYESAIAQDVRLESDSAGPIAHGRTRVGLS